MITKTPGICGGRARIEGTRITVWGIVSWIRQGVSINYIQNLYPHLTGIDIQDALAYCESNKEEIEADIADNVREPLNKGESIAGKELNFLMSRIRSLIAEIETLSDNWNPKNALDPGGIHYNQGRSDAYAFAARRMREVFGVEKQS